MPARNRISAGEILNAIGRQTHDTLTLENQWAKIVITFHQSDFSISGKSEWSVSGHIPESTLPSREFGSILEATRYALDALALFEKGRS